MLNKSMPVSSRTRAKREAEILKEWRKMKGKEEKEKDKKMEGKEEKEEKKKNPLKPKVDTSSECSTSYRRKNVSSAGLLHSIEDEEPAAAICVDDDDSDDISMECSDDPVTSTSGENNEHSDDLDYGEEEEEEEEVELVSKYSSVDTCQIYNSHGKPVGWKRKIKCEELYDYSLDDDDADVEDIIDLTASKPKRRGRKPRMGGKREAQILEECRKMKRKEKEKKEKEMKNQRKPKMDMSAECSITHRRQNAVSAALGKRIKVEGAAVVICVDDDDDDPFTSTSGEDSYDADDEDIIDLTASKAKGRGRRPKGQS